MGQFAIKIKVCCWGMGLCVKKHYLTHTTHILNSKRKFEAITGL